ncbi:MAG: YqgE/AlgH family protein [Acidobacteriota bacterium]|nr:YqgE/AlgH family protein [Acidobacteriota bacterium]MDH3521991.1 YqgE/AlgH family protein [Acidobacteriota bacterium]
MPTELQTPVLLLATPQVLDPFFRQSVVLLLQHSEEGSIGFIINRTTGLRVAEILDGLEIAWRGDQGEAAFFGGPVQPQLGTVLFHRSADDRIAVDEETVTELLPGLLMTQHIASLAALAAEPPGFFRFVLGYAGWGEGQLTAEIERNDWLLTPPTQELLFATDPGIVWSSAMRAAGVDLENLGVWLADDGSTVN